MTRPDPAPAPSSSHAPRLAGRGAWMLTGLMLVRRVAHGVYADGMIHAGNLAYLTLVALFPFFIVAAAVAQLLGETQAGIEAVNGFLRTVPSNVAQVLRPAITDVLSVRTGNLLWVGALVGLWTAASLIETIRDILRRAYRAQSRRPFWHHRLRAIGIALLAVLAAMLSLSLQVMVSAFDALIARFLPFIHLEAGLALLSRIAPTALLFLAFYLLFAALTPSAYRARRFPKWPGAAITALWWYGTAQLLPIALARFASYSLTYGGLAGAMITLIFFFIIGLGVVIGAELNAALADIRLPDEAANKTEEDPS